MSEKIKKKNPFPVHKRFSFNLIIAFVLLTLVISLVISTIGYYRFTSAFEEQYKDSAYRTGETAEILLVANGSGTEYIIDEKGHVLLEPGKIDEYIASGGETEEYKTILNNINYLCEKQNVSIVYVIKVKEDFSEYISVFNAPNMKTTKYTPWEVGSLHPIEDSEYRDLYKQLYAKEIEHASAIRKGSSSIPDHITSLMAIYDTNGDVAALMCVQRPMSELVEARESYMKIVGVFTLLMMVAVIFAWYFFLHNQFLTPLQTVLDEAQRFARTTKAPEKELNPKISRIMEISALAKSINEMEKDTLSYIENLTNITKEKEKMNAELDVARNIQEASLPNVFPAFPEKTEFDLYASMTPAKQVGGDFYDFFLIDDDHLAMVIADVSGKGVPAALFMMVTKILINERSLMGGSPAEIVSFLNNRICMHNDAEMFVTMWLGILELSTGKVIATNAGHDDPAILRGGEKFELDKQKHGLVVGAMDTSKYQNFEFTLERGDKIFLYTDGIPEATKNDQSMFGLDNMLKALNKNKKKTPKEVVEGITKTVDVFIEGAPQFDDMTMLCVEYKGVNMDDSIKLEAKDENLSKAIDYVMSKLEGKNAKPKALQQLEIAMEEIFVNIAHYAYIPKDGYVEIFAEVINNTISITFMDEGKEYNPLERKDPDITESAENREIGGLGIYLTKRLVDKVSYERKDNKNILRMDKKFE